jgi:Bacterial regulatory protein, Fis family
MSLFYDGVCILAVVLGLFLLRAAKNGDEGLDLMMLEMLLAPLQAQKYPSPFKQKPTSENLGVTTNSDLNIVTPTKLGFPSDEESAKTMGFFHQQLQEDKGEFQDEGIQPFLQTSWHKTEAAKQLQWSRMTLCRKMGKYRIPSLSNENGQQRLTTLKTDYKLN